MPILTRIRAGPHLRGILGVFAVGILTVSLPPLALLSFDASFLPKPPTVNTNIVLIYANQETLEKLGVEHGDLSRTNHARLLARLAEEGSQLVFYDFFFGANSQNPEADQALERALTNHGSVILVAAGETLRDQNILRQKLAPPLPQFRKSAKDWGHAELLGNVVRQISPDFARKEYTAWLAAARLFPGKFPDGERNLTRWLNYYAATESSALPFRYFHDVLSSNTVPAGYFHNKIVFVGQSFPVEKLGSAKDAFPTPYSRFGAPNMPGLAIHATAFLNLVQNEWLRLIPWGWQCAFAGIWGAAIMALHLSLSRRGLFLSLLASAFGVILLVALSLYIQWYAHLWWSWIGPAFLQTTASLIWVRLHPLSEHPYIAFTSYRTEDDGAAALLIARSLSERGYKTFIDVTSLTAGRFDEQLLREIENAAFFLLLLSPRSLARCVEQDDWVLRELTHALLKKKQIIPIFKDKFSFKTDQIIPDLPQINELKNHHGITYSNSDFEAFLEKLVERMKLPK